MIHECLYSQKAGSAIGTEITDCLSGRNTFFCALAKFPSGGSCGFKKRGVTVKWAFALVLWSGMAQAATITYTLEVDEGEFFDRVYGDREEVRRIYEEEIAENLAEYEYCMAAFFEGCVTALQFEDYRVRHLYGLDGPLTFDEYYERHFDLAGEAGDLSLWRDGGLTLQVGTYGGFYPNGFPANGPSFGTVTDGGEATGPSKIAFTISENESFVSIDLQVSEGSIGEIGGVSLPAGFNQTFYFDESFAGINTILLNAVPSIDVNPYGSGYMQFSNLVTRVNMPPSPVPLPASLWLMGLGLAGLGALRRRQKV